MPLCPACARPVAVARPRCLYCGAALSAEAVREAERSTRQVREGASSPAVERVLIVLEHRAKDPDSLGRALGLSLFEASQRAARGGFDLLRTASPADAEELAAELRGAGLVVFLVPEAEVRRHATPVRGGGFEDGRVRLLTEEGEVVLGREDLLLVVKGPIAREYQTLAERVKFRTATLPDGYLVHFHLRRDGPLFELDPDNFEFGAASRQGSLLELGLGLEALGAPTDDGFRKLAPALAPAAKEGSGVVAAARALVHASGEGAPVLDNVAQFRLYSGWRGAVERRRS
jgi:hypothetical protein